MDFQANPGGVLNPRLKNTALKRNRERDPKSGEIIINS